MSVFRRYIHLSSRNLGVKCNGFENVFNFFSGLQKWSQGDKRMKKHENFVTTLTKAYNNYKTKYVKRISFNPEEKSLMSKYTFTSYKKFFFSRHNPGSCPAGGSAHLLWHGNLWWDWEGWKGDVRLFGIGFLWKQRLLQHITYVKVTMEAQLGLIGGTMGLLTGFSILSGVEIIYYLLRSFWSYLWQLCFAGFSITSLSSGFSCHSRRPGLR